MNPASDEPWAVMSVVLGRLKLAKLRATRANSERNFRAIFLECQTGRQRQKTRNHLNAAHRLIRSKALPQKLPFLYANSRYR
jgi:hypothetical protein